MDDDDDFPMIMPTLMNAKTNLKTFNFAHNMYKLITGDGQPKSKVAEDSDESNDTPFPTSVIVKPALKNKVEDKKGQLVKVNKSAKRTREEDDEDRVEKELDGAEKRQIKKKKTSTNAEQATSAPTKTKKQSNNDNEHIKDTSQAKKPADDLNNENKIPHKAQNVEQTSSVATKSFKSKTNTTQRALKSKNLNENYRKIDIRKKSFGGKNSKFLSKGAKFKRKQWSKNSRKFGVRFGYNVHNDQDDDDVNRNLIRDPSEIKIKIQEKKEEKIDDMSNEAVFRRLAKEEKMRRNQDQKMSKEAKKKSAKTTSINDEKKDEHESDDETFQQTAVDNTVSDEEIDQMTTDQTNSSMNFT